MKTIRCSPRVLGLSFVRFVTIHVALAVSMIAPRDGRTELTADAKRILTQNCYSCHGKNGADQGGFGSILDEASMIRYGVIVPGNWTQSLLLAQLESGAMPKGSNKLDALSISLIKKWIQGIVSLPPVGQDVLIDETSVLAAVRADLAKLSLDEQQFSRYLSYHHLSNRGGSAEDLKRAQDTTVKLMNSLSWSKDIYLPKLVSPSLVRIDLRRLLWDDSTWDRIWRASPFTAVQGARVEDPSLNRYASYVVSGDWFNANASLASLYYQTLKLPTRLSDLEDILAVNRRENILNLRVARAGFNNSGVSRNNRVIERHATANGAFWMSYDFSDSLGDRNIFSFPLGPFGSLASFKPSGGEMIFNLPNGLQAYYVTDANGRRVDRAPTEIVSDPKRADRAVTSAVSCFSCHGTTGINFKDDQMHSFLASNPQAFDREVRGGIASLYTEPKLMRKWMLEDSRRYIDALSKALATPYGPEQEPITQANQEFESNVTLGGGAAELGLKPVDLAARIKASKRLGELLGGWLVPGGSIARESFLEALPEVLKNLD